MNWQANPVQLVRRNAGRCHLNTVVTTFYTNKSALVRARFFWIALTALHAPALITFWRVLLLHGTDAVPLGSFLSLNLAALFFALKICGVQLLQFDTDRRSRIAVMVAVALMHAGVIDRQLGGVMQIPPTLPAAAGVLLTSGMPRVRRLIERVLALPTQAARRRPNWALGGLVLAVCARAAGPRALARSPRGPPR